MPPTQSDDEKGSEVCVREEEEEDPLTQMLNDLSLADAGAKKAVYHDSANDLVEGLKDLDIKKEEYDVLNEESEPEEDTEEQIKLEKVNQNEEDKSNLDEEEIKEDSKESKEIDETLIKDSIKIKDIKSDDDKFSEVSDDENPPDDDCSNDKSLQPERNYESQSSYKPDLEPFTEKSSIIKSKNDETTKKPKTLRYNKRGLGTGAGGGMEYHNAFPDFMFQDQFRPAAPFSTIQPNNSPAYAWSPDNSQNSSPTHAWSPDNAQNSSPTHAWTPDNSFSMDAFDSSAFNSPPYMSGSDCGNLGSANQMYMNQTNNYLDQYSYPLTPPFSDGASIQDESDFSDSGVPSPMAPSQQEFANEYTMPHDEHSLDDILEVLNQEKFGGLDVTGCVPPEKIMPYLQELLRIPEGSENTDNTNQDVSQIQPRPQARENWTDGRSQTSAEHEIRKRINPEVLEKTTRQINYQENEKLCEKDEEGDTPYMVVVSNYERKNYYELLYAMQERLKTIRICCDLPVCVRTHACKVCGNTDDLQFYSPLSMRNNVGDTALKNAVLMKFPKEVVNYLCGGLEERQGDMRRVFDMETSNFFQQNSFIYPVLARFL